MLYWSTREKNGSDLLVNYKNVDDSPMLTALKLSRGNVSKGQT